MQKVIKINNLYSSVILPDRVLDPHPFEADLDPGFRMNADLDLDADPETRKMLIKFGPNSKPCSSLPGAFKTAKMLFVGLEICFQQIFNRRQSSNPFGFRCNHQSTDAFDNFSGTCKENEYKNLRGVNLLFSEQSSRFRSARIRNYLGARSWILPFYEQNMRISYGNAFKRKQIHRKKNSSLRICKLKF